VTSNPNPHVPEVWVRSNPCPLPELSSYEPTAVQFPAEAHETELRATSGFVAAFAGSFASTPAAHVPPVSVSNRPWVSPELS
jgi:hypothetical protein